MMMVFILFDFISTKEHPPVINGDGRIIVKKA